MNTIKHCQSNFIFYNRLCCCNLSSSFNAASHRTIQLTAHSSTPLRICCFILRVSHNYLCMQCNIRLNRTEILGTFPP